MNLSEMSGNNEYFHKSCEKQRAAVLFANRGVCCRFHSCRLWRSEYFFLYGDSATVFDVGYLCSKEIIVPCHHVRTSRRSMKDRRCWLLPEPFIVCLLFRWLGNFCVSVVVFGRINVGCWWWMYWFRDWNKKFCWWLACFRRAYSTGCMWTFQH